MKNVVGRWSLVVGQTGALKGTLADDRRLTTHDREAKL